MPLTYAVYAAGNTAIVFAKDRTLVLGFMVSSFDPSYTSSFEVLYALHPDGRVKETNPLPTPNHDFNRSGRVWHVADSIPPHAEFIGHYEPDMFPST